MESTPFERLRVLSTGYMQSSVLGAAAEFDLCTIILSQNNAMSAKDLAARLEADPRGTVVLLDALTALDVLEKSGPGADASYSVSKEYTELLDSRHPKSFIPMLRHMAVGQRSWSRLTWVVKDGKPQPRQVSILGAEQDHISFIQGMNSIAVKLADPTVASLKEAGLLEFASSEPRILDIGGASGTYTQAFLRALPQASAVLFDLPVAVAQAQKRFAGSEYEDRVRLISGDFTRDDLPGPCDLAWISAIIHQFGREESRALYRKAFKALASGGTVAVRDYMMSPNGTSPPDGTLFGVNMLVNTANGRVYTFDEVRQDLLECGFEDVRLAVPSDSMSAVAVGRKS